MSHWCLNNELNKEDNGYWLYDGQGIALCKVCPKCEIEKLSTYRPEILEGYSQDDVNEPIDEDY